MGFLERQLRATFQFTLPPLDGTKTLTAPKEIVFVVDDDPAVCTAPEKGSFGRSELKFRHLHRQGFCAPLDRRFPVVWCSMFVCQA